MKRHSTHPIAVVPKRCLLAATLGTLTALSLVGSEIAPNPAIAQEASSQSLHSSKKQTLKFDVSENFKRFIPDETPVNPDGKPAYGGEFITEGYIYPYGTLNEKEDGINPDGSPSLPENVIGKWTCRGWHVGEGAATTTGPIVVTHQLYDLGDKPGSKTLTTDGYEIVDFGVVVQRAVTGGTGEYKTARGEAAQTLLGLNELGGVQLRYEVEVSNR
jgi:hypothetical protein